MSVEAIEEVMTGEVKVGSGGTVLSAGALGSCIAVVMQDRRTRVGGIAHVMLPGTAPPAKTADRLRYAVDAVHELLARLFAAGARREDLVVCLAGGANVLERVDDTICSRNIESVTAVLAERELAVAARSLGGTVRRKIRLDIGQGMVLCAIGSDGEQVLWPRQDEPHPAMGTRG